MMGGFSATLKARDPPPGHLRSYRLETGTDLLGAWLIDVVYGRIGAYQGAQVRRPISPQYARYQVRPRHASDTSIE